MKHLSNVDSANWNCRYARVQDDQRENLGFLL